MKAGGGPWNQLKSENIETLYLLSALKEPVQIDCWTIRTHALFLNKHEYQYSADIFVKNIFKPFHGTGLFIYPLKYIRKSVLWNELRVI